MNNNRTSIQQLAALACKLLNRNNSVGDVHGGRDESPPSFFSGSDYLRPPFLPPVPTTEILPLPAEVATEIDAELGPICVGLNVTLIVQD